MILFIENDPRCPTGLFGTRLRDWGLPHVLWRAHRGEPAPPVDQLTGVIVLGGTMGVQDELEHPHLLHVKAFLRKLASDQLPCLGICLGGQLLAEIMGGAVHSDHNGEKGCHPLSLTRAGGEDLLFSGLPDTLVVFHWHNDSFDVPEKTAHLAFSHRCPGQAFRSGNVWGVQFHPEITADILRDWWQPATDEPGILTVFQQQQERLHRTGEQLLKNFLRAAKRDSEG